jgi:hypothetical protein|tara:strand:- start:1264 stop:1521 length:258 start_codon:yes stop_codon:yes gene_type:complete
VVEVEVDSKNQEVQVAHPKESSMLLTSPVLVSQLVTLVAAQITLVVVAVAILRPSVDIVRRLVDTALTADNSTQAVLEAMGLEDR